MHQLVSALRGKFERASHRWSGKETFDEIRRLDPAANRHMAFAVLRRLRQPHIFSPTFNTILLQGLADALRAEGWGVVLHMSDAASVQHQIEDIARKRYAAYCRAHPECKKVKFDSARIAAVLEKYDTEEARACSYVMGFTLIPPNMMNGGIRNFMPVDAIDGASMRERAAGVMIARATKDANDNIHVISLSVMLAAESNVSLDAVQTAENRLLGNPNPLSSSERVTITDGGVALISSQQRQHPEVSLWRCYRHLKSDLLKRCRDSLPIFEQLVKLPPGRVDAADALMEKLPSSSPLHTIPRNQYCQAYMSPEVCLHGNVTNNMVEITNHMMAPARTQENLFNSMQCVAEILKQRMVRMSIHQHPTPSAHPTPSCDCMTSRTTDAHTGQLACRHA